MKKFIDRDSRDSKGITEIIYDRERNLYNLFKISVIILIAIGLISIGEGRRLAAEEMPKNFKKGVWVTVFSEKKVLYSKEAVSELVKFCKKAGIGQIYLQLYRADQAYYDSKVCDRTKYDAMVKSSGADSIDYLLGEARRANIEVFAWVNCLSLAQNDASRILKRYGRSILTKDQFGRSSIRSEDPSESDKYYLRDDQLFLEAGDRRVTKHLLAVVDEIVERYPLLSGVHLDYIRYPYMVPIVPGSRFNKNGLTYGYGEENVRRFKAETGLEPGDAAAQGDVALAWDDWKRRKITGLVEKISRRVKGRSAAFIVSCAVVPAPERAYSAAFQDWPLWLERGIVDHVVVMNYTKDARLALETAKSAMAQRAGGMVYIGMGNFMMRNKPGLFSEQYRALLSLMPDGIVFFSYDDIAGSKNFLDIISSIS